MRTRAEQIAKQHLVYEQFFMLLQTDKKLLREELRNRRKLAAKRQNRHKTTYHPDADQSPVDLTPDDLAKAVARGTITTDTAMKIARGKKRT